MFPRKPAMALVHMSWALPPLQRVFLSSPAPHPTLCPSLTGLLDAHGPVSAFPLLGCFPLQLAIPRHSSLPPGSSLCLFCKMPRYPWLGYCHPRSFAPAVTCYSVHTITGGFLHLTCSDKMGQGMKGTRMQKGGWLEGHSLGALPGTALVHFPVWHLRFPGCRGRRVTKAVRG